MNKDIKTLLAKQLNLDASKITDESRIIGDLGADSLDVVELLMTMEDEMGISISDEEALNLKTVADIQNIINAKSEK